MFGRKKKKRETIEEEITRLKEHRIKLQCKVKQFKERDEEAEMIQEYRGQLMSYSTTTKIGRSILGVCLGFKKVVGETIKGFSQLLPPPQPQSKKRGKKPGHWEYVPMYKTETKFFGEPNKPKKKRKRRKRRRRYS